MEIQGTVKQVHATEQRGTYSFRNLWITIDETTQYPQTIEVQASQAKTTILDGLNAGDKVTCHINLRGKEWTKDGKTSVFNTLQVWKIDKNAAAQPQPTFSSGQGGYTQTEPFGTAGGDDSSLPF